ncbi:MAG: Sec-independent protein translocase protein tatA/E-like protein [Firmicutes bacterium]|nr:Sec-independent protein translocase protein tatA/E-like protein [Bacillota bacterium]
MFNFSMSELVVILAIALVVFGPSKLPEIGKAVGKGLNEFKRAIGDKEEPVNITPHSQAQDISKAETTAEVKKSPE